MTRSPQGGHVVACLPFFTYGIQFGDLVKMSWWGKKFARVLKQSGLRTFRFASPAPDHGDESHERLHQKILAADLAHEWHGSGYVAILLRDKQDQDRAVACVADFADAAGSCWEVDPEPFT